MSRKKSANRLFYPKYRSHRIFCRVEGLPNPFFELKRQVSAFRGLQLAAQFGGALWEEHGEIAVIAGLVAAISTATQYFVNSKTVGITVRRFAAGGAPILQGV